MTPTEQAKTLWPLAILIGVLAGLIGGMIGLAVEIAGDVSRLDSQMKDVSVTIGRQLVDLNAHLSDVQGNCIDIEKRVNAIDAALSEEGE